MHGCDQRPQCKPQGNNRDTKLDGHPPTFQQQRINLHQAVEIEKTKADYIPIHGASPFPGKSCFNPAAENNQWKEDQKIPQRRQG